jgi:hypothetical protein
MKLSAQKHRCAAYAVGLLGLLFAMGASARLLVTGEDSGQVTGQVRVYSDQGAFLYQFMQPTSGGNLDGPAAIRQGPDGSVYVMDAGNRVVRYTVFGQFINEFIPSSSGLDGAKDMVFGPDGNLYIDTENGNVLRFNGQTGASMGVFVANGSGTISGDGCGVLSEAMGITFAPGGFLLVGNDPTGAASCTPPNTDRPYNVLKFNGTTGAFVSVFIPTNDHRMYDPNGFVIGADGNLYIAEENLNQVSFPGPGRVLRYNGTTGAFINEFVPSTPGGIFEPEGIIFGFGGDLYVASGDGDVNGGKMAYRYDRTTGAFVGVVAGDGTSAAWQDPKGILYLPDPPPVPTLSTWSVVGLSALLLVFGWGLVRRRAGSAA